MTLANVPVPDRATLWGLPEALSAMEMLAEREPVTVGLKVALIVQFPPALRVLGEIGQFVVSMKSPGFAPVSPIEEIVSGPVPVLVSVAACPGLLVPTF